MSASKTSKATTSEKVHAKPPADTMANSTGKTSTSKQTEKRDNDGPVKLGNVDTDKS